MFRFIEQVKHEDPGVASKITRSTQVYINAGERGTREKEVSETQSIQQYTMNVKVYRQMSDDEFVESLKQFYFENENRERNKNGLEKPLERSTDKKEKSDGKRLQKILNNDARFQKLSHVNQEYLIYNTSPTRKRKLMLCEEEAKEKWQRQR